MCGIAGILGSLDAAEAAQAVDTMLAAQIHRGPDDVGHTVVATGSGHLCFGNRRLAVLDLSPLGHQPMRNPDTGDWVVHNGEIYNFKEVRADLESRGHVFRGRSDTEVVLRAYQEWGSTCLDRLSGMFAFSVWDARRRRLLLARDPLGIKPVYVATSSRWGRCSRPS
jgi:asparagine synthase (glutamine-hydrolysing)